MGRRLEGLARLVRTGLTPERLPPSPPGGAPEPARKSWLTLLLAPEALPVEPPRPRPPRRRWLHFLLAPERLDPPRGSGPEVH